MKIKTDFLTPYTALITLIRFSILPLLVIFLLFSCKKSGTDSQKAEKVTIVYNRSIESTQASELIIKKFEEKFPHIEVKIFNMSGLSGEQHDRYVTRFSMKQSDFDVFVGDIIWVAEFADAGYIASLDDMIARDNFDIANFIEGTVQSVTYKQKIWGIPRFTDAGMLYYRKDLIPRPPATWEELMSMARAHQGKEGTLYGFNFQARQYEGLVCNVLEYIHSYGGKVLDTRGNVVINSENSIRGLRTFVDIVNSDFVPHDINMFTEKEAQVDFLSGKAVFSRNWPYLWGLSQQDGMLKDKVGIAPLPAGDSRNTSTLGGAVAMINSNSRYIEEAWEFVKFMSGPEGQKIRAIYGGLAPAYKPLYKDEQVLAANPHYGNEGFFKALSSAVPRPVTPIYPYLSEILQYETYKAINREQTAEEAIINMEKKIRKIISDYEK